MAYPQCDWYWVLLMVYSGSMDVFLCWVIVVINIEFSSLGNGNVFVEISSDVEDNFLLSASS